MPWVQLVGLLVRKFREHGSNPRTNCVACSTPRALSEFNRGVADAVARELQSVGLTDPSGSFYSLWKTWEFSVHVAAARINDMSSQY